MVSQYEEFLNKLKESLVALNKYKRWGILWIIFISLLFIFDIMQCYFNWPHNPFLVGLSMGILSMCIPMQIQSIFGTIRSIKSTKETIASIEEDKKTILEVWN